jgi:hypothetical protein
MFKQATKFKYFSTNKEFPKCHFQFGETLEFTSQVLHIFKNKIKIKNKTKFKKINNLHICLRH